MFCSEIYKQSQSLEMHLGGPENGLGLSANPACCESEAGKKNWSSRAVCWGNSMFHSLKQHHNEMPSAAGSAGNPHTDQMFSISAAFQLQSESTGREAVADESFLQLSVSEGLSPQQCPLSAIPCALFSPQDHADSGLSHGPEELPHGRADVHHAVGKLWVLCTSPFWRGDHLFSLCLSPAISFPSCNPFPAFTELVWEPLT